MICYIAAFTISIFLPSPAGLDTLFLVVMLLDVMCELLCVGAFLWLAIVGIEERRYLVRNSKKPSEYIPISSS